MSDVKKQFTLRVFYLLVLVLLLNFDHLLFSNDVALLIFKIVYLVLFVVVISLSFIKGRIKKNPNNSVKTFLERLSLFPKNFRIIFVVSVIVGVASAILLIIILYDKF